MTSITFSANKQNMNLELIHIFFKNINNFNNIINIIIKQIDKMYTFSARSRTFWKAIDYFEKYLEHQVNLLFEYKTKIHHIFINFNNSHNIELKIYGSTNDNKYIVYIGSLILNKEEIK